MRFFQDIASDSSRAILQPVFVLMDFSAARERMIAEIEAEVSATRHLTGRDHLDVWVIEAMRRVRREDFVPATLRSEAYRNNAMAIDHGQTISQPFVVALMTDLLDLDANSSVLEIGTGSGYQAAVLAQLARQVYSVERIGPLAQAAGEKLSKLGYSNVKVRCADGYRGWPEKAPFDGIIVTAAAPEVPPDLPDQLKPGGRMVIPIGQPRGRQRLQLLTRDNRGNIHSRDVLSVVFVPMIEGLEWG